MHSAHTKNKCVTYSFITFLPDGHQPVTEVADKKDIPYVVKKSKILLVEDNPIVQKVHYMFLKGMNYDVDLAETGMQAIEMFSKEYDLVLLDIGLPDTDGFTVCAKLKELNFGKRVPILALTTLGNLTQKECMLAGIDEVITKPVTIEALEATLLKWLAK